MWKWLNSLVFVGLMFGGSGEAWAVSSEYSIEVTTSGSGSGIVTGSGGFISCTSVGGTASGTCSSIENYPEGLTTVLTATSTGTSSFSSWSGCDSTSDNLCFISRPAGSTANISVSFSSDITAPTADISGVPATIDGFTPFTVLYSFSEDIGTTFTVSDVTAGLSNATASSFTTVSSGTAYSAVITPDGSGDVTVGLAASAVTDSAGNSSLPDSGETALLLSETDTTAPSVSITADVDSFSGTTPFTATFLFSEGITGFELSDITVANGIASGLTGTGDTYTATITPSDTRNVTIDVAADAVSDGSGNGNIAAEQLVIRSAVVKQTQDRIVKGMQSRANQLISNQTTLFEFLQGGRGGFFNAEGSEAAGYFNLSSKHKGLFWFDVKGSWSREASSKTKYGHGTFGSHFEINPNVLLGAMVQFDVAENTDANSSLKSEGWLVGPYAVARHPSQDLYFEAAILYGQTQNRIKPFNTYEDTFKTDRWLFRGAVTGEVVFEDLSLFPNLKLTHTTERQRAYTDSLSNQISEQSISLTELSAGIDFNRPIAIDGGQIALVGGISGIWNGSSGEGGSAGDIVPDYDGGRAKLHLGMNFKDDNGFGASLSGFYDGIGAGDYYAYGASVSLKKQF